ncbi:MAG: head GIN domain-containing protein [Ferruginibacter sp.]
MKKITIILTVLLQSCILFAQDIVNDANAEARTISGSFNAIKVSGGIELYLSQGNDEAVAVSASKDKYKQAIRTEIKNNTLFIYYNEGSGIHISMGNKLLRAYVSFKSLEKIRVTGASSAQISGALNAASLALDLSGASTLKGFIKTTSLSVDLSGASDIRLSGAVTNLKIDAGGASTVSGYELNSDVCSIKATGASTVNITVNKELSARANGASDINYKGNAVIKEMNNSGSGSINKKG